MYMSVSVDRRVALEVLTEITSGGGFNNIILNRELSKHTELTAFQRGFVTEVVNGTLRNLIEIDFIIEQFCKASKLKPYVKNILRMSVYQIYKMRVPNSAAINEAVNLVKFKGFSGLSGFVNGVLRNFVRNSASIVYPDAKASPVRYLCIKYSYPSWIINRFLSCYSFDFVESFCAASNVTPDVTICANSLKIAPEELSSLLVKEGIEVSHGQIFADALHVKKISDLTKLSCFNKGLFHVQDESSILAVSILDPKPNDCVVDVCAAPGGKSVRIAQIMGNKGLVLARDVSASKLKLIDETAKRMGIDIISTEIKDACIDSEFTLKADRVLVDAPCSGLGLLRKKPDIKYLKTDSQILELASLQREILKASVSLLKDGGILVYSTCTLTSDENIDNVNWVVNNLPLELDDLSHSLPQHLLCDTASLGYLELFPNLHGTDGFFIARFKKKKEGF